MIDSRGRLSGWVISAITIFILLILGSAIFLALMTFMKNYRNRRNSAGAQSEIGKKV